MSSDNSFETALQFLQDNGYLLIKNALDADQVAEWKDLLYGMYDREEYCGANSVGNVYFNLLLEQRPDLVKPLLTNPRTTPYIRAIMGRQCQLRSVRAHVNPEEYRQEWHMDFLDYYYQDEKADCIQPASALCMNQTFYLTDNDPDTARLTFLREYLNQPIPDELRPHMFYTDDRQNPFQVWCDNQVHADLYPKAGDAVVFYSHIPHQGAKIGPDPKGEIRANLVFHFQQNPMHPGILFVSDPQHTLDTISYRESFPFID